MTKIAVESAVESLVPSVRSAVRTVSGVVRDQCWSERCARVGGALVMRKSRVRFPEAAPSFAQVKAMIIQRRMALA